MFERICEGVYLVGGGALSDPRDCLVYLVEVGDTVLIDCGAGGSWPRIKDNVYAAGFDPMGLHTLLLTHGHIDHVGAAGAIRAETGCRVVAHEGDRQVLESGDPRRSAASWYGVDLAPVTVDHAVAGRSEVLDFSRGTLVALHTPGHTPGSMVAVLETDDGHRVLFGQDIHGPFSPDFDSDITAWRRSMGDLIALEADILCEGHYGVIRGVRAVRDFIEDHLALHP